MGKVIKLTDHYAICPDCGKINTLVEVVCFEGLNAVVQAGPCKACLIKSGYLVPQKKEGQVLSLAHYRRTKAE